MRQFIKLKLSITTILFLIFNSCLSDDEIKESWWKYSEGLFLGDVISFDVHELKNDSIFINSAPKAIITDRKESILGLSSRKIIIKDIKSNQRSTYIQK